jgi:hypothetical protein
VDEIERVIDQWLSVHAPQHRGHHVQVGGGGILCTSCGLVDLLTTPESAELVLV